MMLFRKRNNQTEKRTPRQLRRGSALNLCLFTIAFTSMVLTGMMGTVQTRVAVQRANTDYERALYLAGAGAHDGLARLQRSNFNFEGRLPVTRFGAGTYSAVVSEVPGSFPRIFEITGIGTAGSITRTLVVTTE